MRDSNNKHGGAVLFLCIIIAAVILIQSILYSGALRRQQEVELRRCMQLQAEHILSQYDATLFRHYGVLALHSGCVDNRYPIFHSLNRYAKDAQVEGNLVDKLSAEDLEKIITGYMRLRFPALAVCDVVSRMSGFFEDVEFASLFEDISDKNVAGYIRPLQNFLSSTDRFSTFFDSFEDLSAIPGLGDRIDDIDDFFDDFRFVLQKQSASIFQAGDRESIILNFYDPSSICYVADFSEHLIDGDANFLLTHLYVNQYITGHFNSAIKDVSHNGQTQEESNIYGTPYTEIAGDDYPYLEYILTGIEDPDMSRVVSKGVVFSVRASINIATCFIDAEKVKTASLLAESISVGLALASGGSLSFPAPVLKYIILVTWALKDAISEMDTLMQGGTVPLFKSEAISKTEGMEELLATSYRDYIGYYLFFVPTDILFERILMSFQRMTGQDKLYSGVRFSAHYQEQYFEVTDNYDMYK